jgi:hypothetical protein
VPTRKKLSICRHGCLFAINVADTPPTLAKRQARSFIGARSVVLKSACHSRRPPTKRHPILKLLLDCGGEEQRRAEHGLLRRRPSVDLQLRSVPQGLRRVASGR